MVGRFQENQVGHLFAHGAQGRHAILGFGHRVIQVFHDAARDRADHAAVVHDQAMFHRQYFRANPRSGSSRAEI
jgi:hypothetical protein